MAARVCAVLLTFLMLGAPQLPSATADEQVVEDGDDSASAIDIASVRQGHYFEYVLYRVAAFEAWEPADLEDGGMVFSFNLDRDPDIERRGILEYIGGNGTQLRATVVDRDGDLVGRAVFRRPGERSVELWFKRRHLNNPKTYRAFVTVETSDAGACSTESCIDRAPDRKALRHRLRKLCSDREPTITGTRANDTIRATRRTDVIAGRGGDDKVLGVSGADVVCGGRGDDVIEGGRGFLFLRGGPGSDRISAAGPRPRPCNDTSVGVASCAYPEAIALGGAGSDLLVGGAGHERLIGGGGDDVLRGRAKADALDGGRGRDEGWGGSGRDACGRVEERHSCKS